MKKKLLYLLLLSLSSIVSYAQTPAYSDSVRCYTRSELQAIANTILDGKEAHELLINCQETSQYKDLVIEHYRVTSLTLSEKLAVKDTIINELNVVNNDLKSTIERKNNKIKWIKAGWVASIVVLQAVTLYILTN